MKQVLFWTKEEDAIMYSEYKRLGGLDCMPLLPGRSYKAIQQRAVTLAISKPHGEPWTDEDDQKLIGLWLTMGCACVKEFPGRSKCAIQTRARKLRLQSMLARKKKVVPVPIDTGVVRISFDEPLVQGSLDRRPAKRSHGFIPGGAVNSVFKLAETT